MTVRRSPARRARARGSLRVVAAPRESFEELEIRTEDGVPLRALVEEPPEGNPVGTCVLAHAMFARKSEFGQRDRPGLAHLYASRGWRTIAFDFRGHGDSKLPARVLDWTYDDLVRLDLPAVVACARARAEGRPVIVVGHSLGAHVALAAQGTGRLGADGILSIAGNVWLRELEPSRLRWAAKRAVLRGMLAVTERVGRLPARGLRIGSDDASARYVRDLFGAGLAGRWASADGSDDYLAALAKVTIPVCSVASDGDLLNCRPACANRFVRRCAGPVETLRIARGDDGGSPPGHMEIVTSERARLTLMRGLLWLAETIEAVRTRPALRTEP